MILRALAMTALAAVGLAAAPQPAAAGPESLLADVVVIGVPGLRWFDVQASPELTALVDQSHVGSISVRTSIQQTCPLDGWLTISAGTRARGSTRGAPCPALPGVRDGRVEGWQAYADLQARHHTGADLGRLGALGKRLCGFGPGAALAVADRDGRVGNWRPDFDPAALAGCNDAVVDAGPMPLRGRDGARKRIADLVAQARAQDRWVLLVGVSEEIAGAHRETLVAMQVPPDDGPRWLTSRSTRRPGLIQLTDITATLLSESAPDVPLDGAEITFGGDRHTDAAAVIEDRLDTNERFRRPPQALMATGLIMFAAHVVGIGWFWWRRSRSSRRVLAGVLLTQGGWFSAMFLATITNWWRWPEPGLALTAVTLAISATAAAAAYALLRRRAALGLAALGYLVLVVDGVLGAPLQVGSMFAQGPVSGGRFYGFGNSTFAMLAVATLGTAAWAGQRLLPRGRGVAAAGVLAVGAVGVVVDGVPAWGADFGGVVALTPAVLLLALLTWRSRVSWRAVLGIAAVALVAVSAFAVADYQRAPGDRAHLGAFVARALDGEVGDVFARKLSMSFGYLNNPGGWALLVAVLVLTAGCVLPERVPFAAYRRFVDGPALARPALLCLALCGFVGMVLNDAGVTVPAVMAAFALPLLVAHLLMNSPQWAGPVAGEPRPHGGQAPASLPGSEVPPRGPSSAMMWRQPNEGTGP